MDAIGTCKSKASRTPLHVFGNLAFGEEWGDAYLGSGAPKEKASPALSACIGHGRSAAEASRKGVTCSYLDVWKKSLGETFMLGLLAVLAAVFLFLYFLFSFFTKIYFRFGNLQKYTPAAQLPAGRDLAARQRGGRGFCAKTFA